MCPTILRKRETVGKERNSYYCLIERAGNFIKMVTVVYTGFSSILIKPDMSNPTNMTTYFNGR